MKQVMRSTGLLACCLLSVSAWGWEMFEISPTANSQQWPSVSGDIVVWQEYVEYEPGLWDWDIYGADLANDPDGLIEVGALEADQMRPSIWGTWVAWEDYFFGDPDVWVSDISDPANVVHYEITPFEHDQAFPRVHGNTVVWQDEFVDPDTQLADWDIYAADITDPSVPLLYPVAAFEADQEQPDVYRSRVVWQDTYFQETDDIESADVWRRNAPDYFSVSYIQVAQTQPSTAGNYVIWQEDDGNGTVDLYGADVSDPDNPTEFLITQADGAQLNARLSGHLVVWQDNRDGAWNIYGFNMVTRQEFQITNDIYNQTRPDIDGLLVVFEDDFNEAGAIYGARLSGPEVVGCPTPVAGDLTGDCRVTMEDLLVVAANWLADGRTE